MIFYFDAQTVPDVASGSPISVTAVSFLNV